jgi:phosphoribosylformylglycinamidine cyclo-ligase
MSLSYEKSGVNIDNADATKKQMAQTMATADPRILHRPGAFASLFDASFPGITHPVLVLKTEEPGSKQKIVFQHRATRGGVASIAFDMINHLIDDIIVVGAKPLAVQDCIVCGKLERPIVLELVAAINEACRQNDCHLVGGETSEQPGVLEAGTYILSASIVGVVEKSKIIDGSKIQLGDTVMAVPSSGLHTNGYSLARALMAQHPNLIHEQIPRAIALPGDASSPATESFLDAILHPHTCYYNAFRALFHNPAVHGIAHITGGGIAGNLNRILPPTLDAAINAPKIRILPDFQKIHALGNVPEADMLKTFHLGVGMTLVCTPPSAPAIIAHLATHHMHAYEIGQIVPGDGKIMYDGTLQW